METGLTTQDAQYMICHGTYGGGGKYKQWTEAEKAAACQRYEELSNGIVRNNQESPMIPPILGASIIVAVVFAAVLGLIIYRRSCSKKTLIAAKKSKPRKRN